MAATPTPDMSHAPSNKLILAAIVPCVVVFILVVTVVMPIVIMVILKKRSMITYSCKSEKNHLSTAVNMQVRVVVLKVCMSLLLYIMILYTLRVCACLLATETKRNTMFNALQRSSGIQSDSERKGVTDGIEQKDLVPTFPGTKWHLTIHIHMCVCA